MPQIKDRELEDIARIGRLCQECISEKQFGEIMLHEMLKLFASRSAVFLELEEGNHSLVLGETITYELDNEYSIAYREYYHKLAPCHKGLQQRLSQGQYPAVSTDKVVDNERRYMQSSYYQDFLRPTKVHQSVLFGLGVGQRLNGLVGLHRWKNQKSYSEADHLKVRLLAPYLSVAIAYRQQERTLRRQSVLHKLFLHSSNADAYLLLDKNLCYLDAGGELDLIRLSEGECSTILVGTPLGGRLPAEISKALQPAIAAYDAVGGGEEYDSLTLNGNIRADLMRDERGEINVLLSFVYAEIRMAKENRMRFFQLTCRQQKIVRLVEAGFVNKQIARRLNISIKTVGNHLSAIYKKTHTHNRTGLLYRLFA